MIMNNLPSSTTFEDWPETGLQFLGYCPICGSSKRTLLYKGLSDRLFGAPGQWMLYQCQECRSGYLDPRPSAETISLAYQNYITHDPEPEYPRNLPFLKRMKVSIRNGYLAKKYGFRLLPMVIWGYYVMYLMPTPLRMEWDHYARHLPKLKPGNNRLLDVGCGNGAFLSRARDAGWEVFGTDFDPEAAKHVRAQGIDVWTGDYCKAPFADESFDVITTHQVIEHVYDPSDFIRYLFKWLKPGGSLWLGTPNFDSKLHRLFGENYRFLHPPQHLLMFTWLALERLLLNSGFINVTLIPRGFHEYHTMSASIALKNGAKNYYEVLKYGKLSIWDKINAWIYDFSALKNPTQGSDLVVIAAKPS